MSKTQATGVSSTISESEAPSSDVAFSPAVKAQQALRGSRRKYARLEERGGFRTRIDGQLADFIAARDSFYLASASADGQPYIQHRGGTPGFLKVLDDRRLAFADFAGNEQYITAGNLSENDRVQLFLMDYPNRRRIKIWGRARVVEDDPDLLDHLRGEEYRAVAQRAVVIDVTAWDINCPKYITQRYAEAEPHPENESLRQRIVKLEAEIARLQSGGGQAGQP
jgi:predicted pyridoxine 5'-phosphate oxidase superfamily flavin-nucleotide-binding protein